eukprot:TRINITY_DN17249_c0_g1_i2.p1 TRINITY_DN17249_c0_g1~~TRINITY_DN17249_c0_g1_i2.p1  ORF type:complete len:201 (+),score=12.94 TRINITY_DN17249_c0_g1_i2:71-673(+)
MCIRDRFYEQAAYNQLLVNPPKFRRFFKLLFYAGEIYKSHKLSKNSISALAICYKLCEGKYWGAITHKLFELLIDNFNAIGDVNTAFVFYKSKLLMLNPETEYEEIYAKLLEMATNLEVSDNLKELDASALVSVRPYDIVIPADTLCSNNEECFLGGSVDEDYNKTQSWSALRAMLAKGLLTQNEFPCTCLLYTSDAADE